MLDRLIEEMKKDCQFWDELVNNSPVQSGPFDGGCLIVAKAIIRAIDGGELVRLISRKRVTQTEHYGVMHKGVIYDFDGSAKTPDEWIKRFVENEQVYDRVLSFATGYDENSSICDDARTTKNISKIIMRHWKPNLYG